jgi:hypothetical protein
VEHDRQEYLSREYVTKQTEGKRNHLANLGHDLEQTNHGANTIRLVPWGYEEFGGVLRTPIAAIPAIWMNSTTATRGI